MKRSLLLKMGLLLGITAGMGANAQVFNAHDIQTQGYYRYAYQFYNYTFYNYVNTMTIGQGALTDPGNNIWNGFGNFGGPGSRESFGPGRPDDALLPGNPGNPYAWTSYGGFASGSQSFFPASYASYGANYANATSSGSVSPVTIPYINFGFSTYSTAGLDPGGSTRTDVPLTLFSAAEVVNTSSPGAGTAANPLGLIVLSNVPPGTYDLYLYGANPDGTRGASFIVDSGTPTNGVYQPKPESGPGRRDVHRFELGVNYVVYNNVTPNTDSTIHISWGAVSNSISGLSGRAISTVCNSRPARLFRPRPSLCRSRAAPVSCPARRPR